MFSCEVAEVLLSMKLSIMQYCPVQSPCMYILSCQFTFLLKVYTPLPAFPYFSHIPTPSSHHSSLCFYWFESLYLQGCHICDIIQYCSFLFGLVSLSKHTPGPSMLSGCAWSLNVSFTRYGFHGLLFCHSKPESIFLIEMLIEVQTSLAKSPEITNNTVVSKEYTS